MSQIRWEVGHSELVRAVVGIAVLGDSSVRFVVSVARRQGGFAKATTAVNPTAALAEQIEVSSEQIETSDGRLEPFAGNTFHSRALIEGDRQ